MRAWTVASGVKTAIEIVDEIGISGVPSNRRAKIDYNLNALIFEAAPAGGAGAEIEASWKTTHRYRTANGLALEMSAIELPANFPNFAIEPTKQQLDAAVFSSNGKMNWVNESVTRWVLADKTNERLYSQQGKTLVEYDSASDTYSELAAIPDATGLHGNESVSSRDTDLDITLPDILPRVHNYAWAFVIDDGIVYSVKAESSSRPSATVGSYRLDGSTINANLKTVSVPGTQNRILSMTTYNNQLYMSVGSVGSSSIQLSIISFPLPLTSGSTQTTHCTIVYDSLGNPDGSLGNNLVVTSDRFIVGGSFFEKRRLYFFTHDGTPQASEERNIGSADIWGMARTDTTLFILTKSAIRGYSLSNFNEDSSFAISGDYRHLYISGTRLYSKYKLSVATWNRTIYGFRLTLGVSYDGFVGFYVVTTDFDNFYIFATNTAEADVLKNTGFNRCRIYKYNKTADTIAVLLGETKGQPQLSMPFDFINEVQNLGDNRKSFAVMRRTNKDYIFYRRVQVGSAGVAMYDVTADTVTDIYKETWTGNANKGLPYSIDFLLDEQSDGIYVYTFVPSYTTSSASLKVYRKRVLPDATQSEIYSESWSSISSTSYYPMSVSGLMLAEDRSKLYFVLDYRRQSASLVGKAELCTIAKSGSGSRTVIKTYTDPLLCARSPLLHGGAYHYIEGGWVRRSAPAGAADIDRYDYPNEGGRLIEVLSDDTVSDEGVLLRSAGRSDSPDPAQPRYDGFGLHNSVVSNLFEDMDGQLGVVAGFGLPIQIATNRPLVPLVGPASEIENFVWITHGKGLASKIQNFDLQSQSLWQGLSNQALMTQSELGFIPDAAKVESYLTANPSADEWEAYASLFFSASGISSGSLRTGFAALVLGPPQLVNFDSGSVNVIANLASDDAYSLSSSHANTAGLELVALSFGGDALKVIGGAGNGDLTIDVSITAQSVKATPVLYYKDGSAPTSNTDGTVIAWSTGPTFTNNAVTAQAATGEVDDADLNRYYWIVPQAAPDVIYDSGEQVASASVNILDTDAVPVPTITESGVLTTEDISGFGIVFKTERAFQSLTITFKGNPSVGVAFRIRSSTTKPTASTDAKNYGTQHAEAGGQQVEVTVTATLSNVAANTYFFLALSGGGNRDVSGRKIRFNGTYTGDLSPVAVNITSGTVRVRFDYNAQFEVAPTIQIDGVGVDDFPPGLCLIGRELFRYTGRSVNGAGIQLSGVTRAVEGSVKAAHAALDAVHFVDRVLRDDNDSMLTISNKRLDLQNLRNKIVIPFRSDGTTLNHIVDDSTSIAAEGEWELSLSNTYFSKFDEAWMERLGTAFLDRYKTPRTVLQAQIPLSLSVRNGDVVVVRTAAAALIDYMAFEVMGFRHDFLKFQTVLELRALY